MVKSLGLNSLCLTSTAVKIDCVPDRSLRAGFATWATRGKSGAGRDGRMRGDDGNSSSEPLIDSVSVFR